jgi:predicted MPP superfamily phosphohydrolase
VFIAVFALLIFSCWYAPGRLGRWLKLKKSVNPLRAASLLLIALYMLVIMRGYSSSVSPLLGLLYNLLGLFMIFHVYLFFLTILADLARLCLKRKTVGKIPTAILIAVSLSLVAFAFVKARGLTITETQIKIKGLEKPVTLVHAPDLHLGAQRGGDWLEETIEAINGLNPDLVVYNGDLADSDVALTEEIFGLFRKVSAPQFMTTGNHEYYVDTSLVLSLAEKAGLNILRNEVAEVFGFQLVGLEYMNADRQTFDAHMVNDLTIEEELPKLKLDRDRPIVLFHHSPVGLEYVRKAGADAMLSGHTHGGQVFPGTILIQTRFKYWKGLYQEGDTALLVSRGAGTFGPWARLGSFNEIQLVRLVPL